MGTVLMPVRRSDETRSNTAMRAYGAVYKGAGINIMNLQLNFGYKDVLALCAGVPFATRLPVAPFPLSLPQNPWRIL